MIAGVAAGLAHRLGVDPVIVRIGFVILALSGGFGVIAYVVLWLVLPDEGGTRRAPIGRLPTGRIGAQERLHRALALALILLGSLLLLREVGLWVGDRLVWPAVLAAVGLALAWPESTARQGWKDLAPRLPGRPLDVMLGGQASVLRIGLGVAALGGGVVLFLVMNRADFQTLGQGLLAVVVTLVGVSLIFGPWWWRLARDFREERRQRVRADERAEVAARLHDSVLQTLALIQRRADDPAEATRLARRQERELRAWLYGREPLVPDGLRSAIRAGADEIEDLFATEVEVIMVGDSPTDERLEALVSAAKEAMVNAAKFAGVATVSVYLEVEPDQVTAFVRDRGRGFDPAQVVADRKGITESIVGRMRRHGGTATVRSTPGEGTEVELVMPRGQS